MFFFLPSCINLEFLYDIKLGNPIPKICAWKENLCVKRRSLFTEHWNIFGIESFSLISSKWERLSLLEKPIMLKSAIVWTIHPSSFKIYFTVVEIPSYITTKTVLTPSPRTSNISLRHPTASLTTLISPRRGPHTKHSTSFEVTLLCLLKFCGFQILERRVTQNSSG